MSSMTYAAAVLYAQGIKRAMISSGHHEAAELLGDSIVKSKHPSADACDIFCLAVEEIRDDPRMAPGPWAQKLNDDLSICISHFGGRFG